MVNQTQKKKMSAFSTQKEKEVVFLLTKDGNSALKKLMKEKILATPMIYRTIRAKARILCIVRKKVRKLKVLVLPVRPVIG
jgi:hypothetical protein